MVKKSKTNPKKIPPNFSLFSSFIYNALLRCLCWSIGKKEQNQSKKKSAKFSYLLIRLQLTFW